MYRPPFMDPSGGPPPGAFPGMGMPNGGVMCGQPPGGMGAMASPGGMPPGAMQGEDNEKENTHVQ